MLADTLLGVKDMHGTESLIWLTNSNYIFCHLNSIAAKIGVFSAFSAFHSVPSSKYRAFLVEILAFLCGQNLLQHARETANLCAVMASELGLNPKKAKRAGLLHDIGKVPDEEAPYRSSF